jgi:hypothetical protein
VIVRDQPIAGIVLLRLIKLQISVIIAGVEDEEIIKENDQICA